MKLNVMSKHSIHALELLDSLVDSLLPASDTASDIQLLVILVVYHALGNFGMFWILSNVAVV